MGSIRQVTRLRHWHYIVYRSAKTNRRRKFNPRVKLYAEIYSKKTHKRVGYLNKVEKNRPEPRRFSNKAKLLYHDSREPVKTQVERTVHDSIRINYNNWIPDQIPKWFTDLLNDQVKLDGYVLFSLRMTGVDNKKLLHDLVTETKHYYEKKTRAQWKEILTNLIVSTLRTNQIRTSPKKHTIDKDGYKYWIIGKTKKIAEYSYIKSYKVQLILKGI